MGRRASAATSVLLPQPDHVRRHGRELLVADLVAGEARHGAHAIAHLDLHGELRQRLVVERRTEPTLAAWMTLRAVAIEHPLSERELRARSAALTDERLAAPRGMTRGQQRREQRCG